jgi:aminocarboxymuconate-semialdehyde decarboxylase
VIIDVFNHFMPRPYLERLAAIVPDHVAVKAFPRLDTLVDVDARLRLVEEFEGLQQVLSLANPPLELVGPPPVAAELARIANDSLADVCRRHPHAFPAFIAALPMNDVDATLGEIDRAIRELGARGIQVFTNVHGKPLSAPEFRPIFERMARRYDLPVWIHPIRGPQFPDYASERASENEIWFTFGWPYETTAAVTRLIYSGIYDELPGLKIVTHHMGGMIPYYAGKIGLGFSQIFFGETERNPAAEKAGLKRKPVEYYRMLYADTALNGNIAATRCGHDFFGSDHCLFATDAPFDAERGNWLIGGTIEAVGAIETGAAELARIRAENAKKLLRLA